MCICDRFEGELCCFLTVFVSALSVPPVSVHISSKTTPFSPDLVIQQSGFKFQETV